MRLYLPATINDLRLINSGELDLSKAPAHGATQKFIGEYEAEGITDMEEVEFGAFLNAVDDSLMLIANDPSVAWRRLVISVDVPDAAVTTTTAQDQELASSAVVVNAALPQVKVACFHIDEVEAAQDIQAVFEGNEDAIVALSDRDLLWYDISEISDVLG